MVGGRKDLGREAKMRGKRDEPKDQEQEDHLPVLCWPVGLGIVAATDESFGVV